ncbi:MAG: hypothetical protein LBD29_01205 [Treponema sp.]|jgi:TolB-like protein|nr:hypothetical protein [Treponema sp.]
MKNDKLRMWVLLGIVSFFAVGCAGTPAVEIKVNRVPAMNTTSIRRIAVQPFTASDNSAAQKKMASVITTEVTRRIQETNYFIMVDYSEVERLQKAGENIENYVDAVFIGEVVSLKTDDSQRTVEMYNILTRRNERITYYRRTAELSFSYNFKRSRDGSLVGVVTKRGIAEDEQTSSGELKSEDQLLQMIVTHRLQMLPREVAPWTETKSVNLMGPGKRASKPTVKRMKEAFEYVEEGSYNRALDIYLEIYADTGSFEAGYNGSLLYEARGDIARAKEIAQQLYDETGNPQAQERIAQIDRVIAEQAAVEGVYSDTRSQIDKVIETVIPLVINNLPKNQTVALQNVSNSADRSLADRVINEISYTLREKKITLVDRNNQQMLDAERSLQSDNWEEFDDLTIASFGQKAGVQVFVLVSITGTSSARMLQVRLLDVASGTIIYQTPPSEAMQL